MKTCLVCGNGPSLRDVRNSTLAKFDTFGGNRCYLKFVPTYYVYVDPQIGRGKQNIIDDINSMDCEKFIEEEFAVNIDGAHPLHCVHRMGFSRYVEEIVFAYFSVTTVMIQLAHYMGYKRIGLVGIDHRYETPRGDREWHPAYEDVNHFSENYYKNFSTIWKAPKLDDLTKWHQMAKKLLDNDGVEVVNLTPNSGLKVYKFGRLEDWL